jgi:hypothetical protein
MLETRQTGNLRRFDGVSWLLVDLPAAAALQSHAR